MTGVACSPVQSGLKRKALRAPCHHHAPRAPRAMGSCESAGASLLSDIVMASVAAGGSGEIRTHGWVPPSLVFKTSALNHSATLPHGKARIVVVGPRKNRRQTGRRLPSHDTWITSRRP